MELAVCPRCGQELAGGLCPMCGELFVPRCYRCGNTLVFEQVQYGQAKMLRCGICSNEMDFEVTALREEQPRQL